MQQGYFTQAASIVGIILIVLGILLLAYYLSPVRLMLGAFLPPHKPHLVPPILGGIALVSGIALLYATRLRD
jgi:hypothetical protein